MKKFIFDIDGTLTPSRGKIDPEFLQEMLYFAGTNDVYFVTGSDREKTLEQVGLDLYNSVMFMSVIRTFIGMIGSYLLKQKDSYRMN